MNVKPWKAEWIRSIARIHTIPLDRYKVCVARAASELEEAFALVQEAYRNKGIVRAEEENLRIVPQQALRESMVFVAVDGDKVVASTTVTLDSPAGLPLDKDYRPELDRLRARGARIAEYNSLAVHADYRGSGVAGLLFLGAYWGIREVLKASHVCIGVNPKVEERYGALFAFERLGTPKAHTELSAPVVALVHEVADVREFFRRHHRKRASNGKTVYELWFEQAPACIHIPRTLEADDPETWHLSRKAFQEIFMRRSKRLETLDPSTLAVVRCQRSDETLQVNGNN